MNQAPRQDSWLPPDLASGGEASRLLARFDWAATSIGPLADWPAALRSTLAMMLQSPVPIVTLWGEDGIMIYNDAYSDFAGGRHPALFGSKVREGWPEVAEFNDRMMKEVLAGRTLSFRDQELILHRSGAPEQVWMDLDYSPVLNEEGEPIGVIAIVVETTSKVLAERRLSTEHERLRQMFELAPGFAALFQGPDHVYVSANEAYFQLIDRRDVIGLPLAAVLPEGARQFGELLEQVHRTGESYVGHGHRVLIERGGSTDELILDFLCQPVRDQAGQVSGVFVQGHDVSDEHRSLEALREREEQLSAFIQQSTAGFAQVDLNGTFTLVNDRFCELVGRSREELMTMTMQEITHPEDLPANVPKFERAVREGVPFTHEKRYVRPDGSIVWVNNSVSVIRKVNGELYGVLAVTIDVTERRIAEAAVRESEARLRALADNLPRGIVYQVSIDAEGQRTFLFLSQNHGSLTGLPAEEVIADPAAPFRQILPEDRERLRTAEAEALAEMRPFDVEMRMRLPDGRLRWFRLIAAPRAQPDGSVIWDGFNLDISDQKDAEAAIRESEAYLARAIAIAKLGTFEWQLRTGEVHLDDRSRELFAVPPGERLSVATVLDRIHPDDVERVRASVESVRENGRRFEIEFRVVAPDGSTRFIATLSDAVCDEKGKPERMVGVFGDITERKRLEEDLHKLNETLEQRVRDRTMELEAVHEQLRQSQKLEAIGQLTGGVAHDFNNLLTVIRSSADLLRRREISEEKRRRYIDAISDTADRAAKLTSQLLAFARRQTLKPEVFEVGERTRALTDMLATVVGARIRIVREVDCGRCFVEADPSQFETAIVNMAINARDAMEGEGELRISINPEDYLPPVRGHGGSGDPFVSVSISDTGTGISADNLARIFEPFFTTKEVGKGTGLGLSQVFGFAKQSGGEVRAESELGHGATFKLYLPRVPEPSDEKAEAAEDMAEMPERGRVLVVEDNDQVGDFASQLLADLGFETRRAGNANEALADIERNAGEIDIVFSDVVMPGMSGIELARLLRERYPAIRVILTSGYSHVLAQEGVGGFDLLQKPYSVEGLSRLLARR